MAWATKSTVPSDYNLEEIPGLASSGRLSLAHAPYAGARWSWASPDGGDAVTFTTTTASGRRRLHIPLNDNSWRANARLQPALSTRRAGTRCNTWTPVVHQG